MIRGSSLPGTGTRALPDIDETAVCARPGKLSPAQNQDGRDRSRLQRAGYHPCRAAIAHATAAIIDGAQSVPHMPLTSRTGCDFHASPAIRCAAQPALECSGAVPSCWR
jgi:hypothetical protein